MENEVEKPEKQDEDHVPATDEEYAEYQKQEKRTAGVISLIVDLITGFFH